MTYTTLRRHRIMVIPALLIAGGFALTLTSCSAASDVPTASDVTAGAGAKWGSCMRDAGFNVEDPTDADVESGAVRAPTGADQEEYVSAGSACRDEAGVEGSSDADKQKWERQNAKVASCIRERGFADFPEQRPGVLDFGAYERGQEPGFQKVVQRCMQQFAPDTRTQNVG